MTRWYDKYEELTRSLEVLKGMSRTERNPLVKDVLNIIREEAPDIIDDTVMEYPLDSRHRRWYDRDPYLWLMVNSLQYAESSLVRRVAIHMEERLALLKTN